MLRKATLALALIGSCIATTAAAQSFTATLGVSSVNPKGGNGTLAGARASIDDDASTTASFAYGFDENWSAELWTGLGRFNHTVSLAGLGDVGKVSHRPTSLSVNYHFLPGSRFRPFVGLGYTRVSLSGERAIGAIAGSDLSAGGSNGYNFNLGVDVALTDSLFLRGDARYLDFDTQVKLDGADIGTANVDPWVYGLSLGLRF
ncbi:MAG TPA: OmpW family outer membrane protein [Rhodanobacteraceae bacterium]|nr:OmpW family outer membrane protein [Rhodanobacteraceae bacterium]